MFPLAIVMVILIYVYIWINQLNEIERRRRHAESDRNTHINNYKHSSTSSFQSYNRQEYYPRSTPNSIDTEVFIGSDFDDNVCWLRDTTSTHRSHTRQYQQEYDIPSTSTINNTRYKFQSPQYQQYQTNHHVKQSQRHYAGDRCSPQHQASTTQCLSKFYVGNTGHPNPSINPSSALQDALTTLKNDWKAEMQIEEFIRSKVRHLPRQYQDLCTEIVKRCKQAIQNHLEPDWSATLAKYTQMMKQDPQNKSTFDPTCSKGVKDNHLDRIDTMSLLRVYLKQRNCFDSTIKSYLNKIVEDRRKIYLDQDLVLDKNPEITVIMDKINLEIKRLSARLSTIYVNRQQIQEQVKSKQIVIIKGQTGCGKSTQIPQYIAELKIGKVICTQPTKIAAISLANYLTQEYAQMGCSIDYIVDHNSLYRKSSNDTSTITFVTDSILLDILVNNPTLSSYSCVIVDEVHQRSLYTDILLALLKQVLARRSKLKLIIISENVDTKLFSDYFNNCPVIKIFAKPFSVDIKWCNEHVGNCLDKALDTVVDIHNKSEKGDILVFLTTPDETEKACADIKKRFTNNRNNIIALALHNDLQFTNLENVFKIDSNGRRKIIFTTHCAETSMTIPGIGYVIDTGLIKERIYDKKSNSYSQCIHSICQKSAAQRCDRAGYAQSGVCYRLYSQQVYNAMSQLSDPEIMRIPLSSVILKMIKFGVHDISNFNFIQSPSSQNISDSLDILYMFSAITKRTSPLKLTSQGKLFCKLPLEARLSALIINAKQRNLLPEGVIVASALSISRNLYCRYGSEEDKHNLNSIHQKLSYNDGDIISTVQAYLTWRSLFGKIECNRWCFKNQINWKLMKHLDFSVKELEQSLRYLRIINRERWNIPLQLNLQRRNKLRQLILNCFSDQLALFTGLDTMGYIAISSNKQYLIHKSSTLFSLGLNPKFVVYQDILTSWDDFLINITPIDKKWLKSSMDDNNYAKINDTLNNVIVTQSIDNLGSIILSQYDANSIDKIIKNLLQQENIRCNIKVNIKGGNLEIMTIKSKMPRLLDIINESVMHKKEKLIKAIKILSKNDNNDSQRLIVGTGIIVKDILLSSDCIEFNITLRYTGKNSPDEDTAIEAINQVQAHIIACGELAVDIDRTSINKSKDYKHIQFDKIVYQQIRSQSLIKEFDRKIISGYEINIENGSLANCSISRDRILVQFRWPRKRRNGKGSITCRDRFTAIQVKNDFPLTISNQIIYACIDRCFPYKLYLRQIPNFVTAADIRMAIPIVNRAAITEIYFNRVAAAAGIDDDISSSNLESTLRSTLDKYGYYGMYSDVTIKPLSSVKRNPNIIADVTFRTYHDAVSAVQSLNNEVIKELINEPISVRLGHSRIIKCQKEIYLCIASQLNRLQQTIQRNGSDPEKLVHIKVKPSNNKYPLTSIIIRSWNESSLNKVVRQISNIIEPVKVQIDVYEILEYLNIQDRKSILASVNSRFKAFAKIDWKSQCIFIYGVKAVKEQALDYCQKQINQLLSICKAINLVGNDKPTDLVKTVIKRYGINMNKLLQLSGADFIRLNRKNKTLIVIGEEESYTNVLNQIELCCNSPHLSKEKSSDEISANECVVCLCQADDDHYRLQYCGHLYCQQCITEQMNDAINSSNFPVNCVNCNQGFVIEDLKRLLAKLSQPKLCDVLLTEFVGRNPNAWHYCPTPGCESVYRRSKSYSVFTCPICQKKTCCACDTEDHPRYDCNEIKLYRNNPSATLENFLTQNSESVKKCPKCSAAIEKTYGCHHMTCRFCHTHFCWLCSAGFDSYKDCYSHLQQKHTHFEG